MLQEIEDLGFVDAISGTDGFERFQRASAAEGSHPSEGEALFFGEQIVAPINECLKALLVRQAVSLTTSQESKTIAKTFGDLLNTEQLHAGGRQFNSEGHAVQATTNLRYRRGIGAG